ncbi:MAG: pyridoxal phosphate-dependent aminotransferase [Burkholderiaceae bacterium]
MSALPAFSSPATPFPTARRNALIAPFHVMEIMKDAARMQAAGQDIIHMSIGEPDFTAPPAVAHALARAVTDGQTAYTAAVGTAMLREAIAQFYQDRFHQRVDPARIIITAGASGAMLLALAALIDAGDEVLLPDPSYPCNRHFVSAVGGAAKLMPCGPAQRFQPSAADIARYWSATTKGVMLASPSNPTGTSILPDELRAIHAEVRKRGGFLMVDEIYQSLSYDHAPTTALALGDDILVINSFSKYFNMTGWRLGWLVVPPWMVADLEKLSQNLYICASTLAQHAALACFEPATLAIYEERRAEFQKRRDYLVPALNALGLTVPVMPDGAFYVYADCSKFATDSGEFCERILRDAHVCIVPGKDFGHYEPQRYVRLSYATALPRIEEAVRRITKAIA